MNSGVYVHHRYGTHNGSAKIKLAKGASAERSTQKVMTDKARYNQTRFQGEDNPLYAEGAELISDYQAAYTYTSQAADQIAAQHCKGRSAGKAYIYDTTLNAGDGRVSCEEMHGVISAYKAEMEARGYTIGGLQYAIHDNGHHTHAHLMYATQRTIQRADDRSVKTVMRSHTEQAKQRDQLKTAALALDQPAQPLSQEQERGR
ncbi:hypothetical protein GCM10022631_25430 [Deinococcus rubellus]|uniref:hypothetical protein n=1 Tax=Deinococcus rubellus TaxID=1889240 RepID=UPI0031E9D6DB